MPTDRTPLENGRLEGERVLVTGGAGFIGSHLCRALLDAGAEARVLDLLDPQVHGEAGAPGTSTPAGVELLAGDVADAAVLGPALDGVTMVVHFAAAVGVGQSMYEIRRYCEANTVGTAALLEALAPRRDQVRKLVVASSMSIYGEGLYRCGNCGRDGEAERRPADLEARRWDPRSLCCGTGVTALPTPETKPVRPTSVYAINKRDQEELCLVVGAAYGIPTLALRFFNVYGPGQALSNPYTGVAAIFSARLLSSAPPLVFEDGQQSRDFVHVEDVARACVAALTQPADGTALNIGTGTPVSVIEVAALLRKELGGPEPEIMSTYRAGDVRHCYADIGRARALLAWEPETTLDAGIPELADWVRTQVEARSDVDTAMAELHRHGLVT